MLLRRCGSPVENNPPTHHRHCHSRIPDLLGGDAGDVAIDDREVKHPPQHPLLPFLEKLSREVPTRWDDKLKKYVTNDDWLLWELDSAAEGGEIVEGAS